MATEFGGPTPKGGTEIQIPHAILEPLQQIKLTYQHKSKHKDSLLRNRLGVNKSNANSGMKHKRMPATCCSVQSRPNHTLFNAQVPADRQKPGPRYLSEVRHPNDGSREMVTATDRPDEDSRVTIKT